MAQIFTTHTLVTVGAVWLFLVFGCGVQQVNGIGCFVCSSVNGSNPDCEDTFNNTGDYYEAHCWAGRKGRRGIFPATDCVKLKAERGAYTVLIRDCTVDNGDLTSDTEMGRDSQCSMVNIIEYNDVVINGCSTSCYSDGCNTAGDLTRSLSLELLVALIVVLNFLI